MIPSGTQTLSVLLSFHLSAPPSFAHLSSSTGLLFIISKSQASDVISTLKGKREGRVALAMSVSLIESNPFHRKPHETSAYVLLARTLSHGFPLAAREARKGKNLDQQTPALKIRALFTKEKIGMTTEQLVVLVIVGSVVLQ